MIYVWLAIFVISLIIELAVPALVSIWFTAGSLLAFITALIFKDALWLQIVVFVVTTALTIYFLRPLIKRFNKTTNTNVDSLIGSKGICVSPIKHFELGTIKVNGLVWNAYIDENDEEIKENDLVSIIQINGNKLLVKKYVKEI